MRPTFSFVTALLVLCTAYPWSLAQTTSPPESESSARQQAADSAFADAERRLTIRLLDRAIAQADANGVLINDVKSAAKALSDRMTSLKTNDDGKRLAAALDELSAGQVQQLFNEPPVSPDVVAAKQKENEAVSADLKKLHDNAPAGFVVPEQQQDDLLSHAPRFCSAACWLERANGMRWIN